MKNLVLYEEYDRRAVHAIFSPETVFTPQAGTWGLQGMVGIPDRPGDFVFFVTYGQSQSMHDFDESITEDGVLSWQSQPAQDFSSKAIKDLIAHDENINSIYLFLRTRKERAYCYLGKLKYITHDTQRVKPVYFQWQILNWDISNDKLSQIGLNLVKTSVVKIESSSEKQNLIFEDVPPLRKEKKDGVSTAQFKSVKQIDYAARDSKNRNLGLAGEELVIAYELKKLHELGRKDLAEKVRHVAKEEGDGAGYDILSFDEHGNKKYIEVKTTKGIKTSDFYASINEINFSNMHSESYYLYRLYEFDEALNTAEFFILKGALSKTVRLKPISFKASFEFE